MYSPRDQLDLQPAEAMLAEAKLNGDAYSQLHGGDDAVRPDGRLRRLARQLRSLMARRHTD